jgi:RNA-directed DNA polymerase
MEELHAEGLATRGDPESCAASCEGRGEALAGARAGRAIEPRNVGDRGADAVGRSGRQHPWRRYREPSGGPARSGIHGMCGTFVRENREVPCLPVRVVCGRAAGGTLRR